MTAATALTAQNTQGVFGIHYIPSDFVVDQIDACINDIGVDVVKIGTAIVCNMKYSYPTPVKYFKKVI